MEKAQPHSWHHLRELEGRVLPLPEHLEDRTEINRLLRKTARTGKSRCRARRRLRRGRLYPPQLRDKHSEHREGPRPPRTFLQEPIVAAVKGAWHTVPLWTG